ncbi:caspase domain-containing protein [Streptomyces sp. NPDC101118]|uniref:caspase family protein n=1 Tax=Streptomyces sp. NPDC101118 TaxID=3366109 RepID=UPI0038233F42
MSRLPDRSLSRAYLFGAASYAHEELPDLPAVANNVRDLGALLTGPSGGFAPEHCTAHLDPSGTVDVFNELSRHADEALDTLLVYFAGHGMVRRAGELYLALPATRRTDLAVTGFAYDLLREVVGGSTAVNKVVILDCCFSGWAVQGMGGEAAASPEELEIEGSYVLTATPATAKALAPDGALHTSFTGELLYVLRSGVPDAGELLPLDDVTRAVRQRALLRGLPLPEVRAGGSAGRLALARNAAVPRTAGSARSTSPVSPPPPLPPAPPVPVPAPVGVARPLALGGALYSDRRELANALRAHGPDAARRFFARMGTPAAPSEGWSDLLSWLKQFGNPHTDDIEGRITLVDHHLTSGELSPELKLLCLLRWLDPAGPVVHHGQEITYGSLARACLAGRHASTAGRALVAELAGTPLLDVLAGFDGLAALRGVREPWRSAVQGWGSAVRPDRWWPEEARQWAADVAPGALLARLLPADAAAAALGRLPAAAPLREPPYWYELLIQAAGGPDTLPGRLIAADLVPVAQEEAHARRLAAEAAGRVDDAARQRDAEWKAARERAEAEQRAHLAAEAVRLSPRARRAAALRALAIPAAWAVVPVAVVWITWWNSSYQYDAAVSLTQLAALASASTGAVLARRAHALGAAYRPSLRSPSTWLPPLVPALAVVGVLAGFWLIAGDWTTRSAGGMADSDLLGTDSVRFHELVDQNSYDSAAAALPILVFAVAAVCCAAAGVRAGRTLAGRAGTGQGPPGG